MKRLASLITILLNNFTHCSARCNYPTTTHLGSQTAIEDYLNEYSSCTIHQGNLTNSSNSAPTIPFDLSSLSFLTEVTGDLTLAGPKEWLKNNFPIYDCQF